MATVSASEISSAPKRPLSITIPKGSLHLFDSPDLLSPDAAVEQRMKGFLTAHLAELPLTVSLSNSFDEDANEAFEIETRKDLIHRILDGCLHVGITKQYPIPDNPDDDEIGFQLEQYIESLQKAKPATDAIKKQIRLCKEFLELLI
jgi:hypothetical protein